MQINLLVEGGSMKPGPALSQKLGPLGLNANQVIQKVNEATKGFAGMKVPVELDINTTTKEITVKVFSPPVSELLRKELGAEKGSGAQAKVKIGNMSIEQIISIAKMKKDNLLSRDLKAAVREVVGTCTSLGILIESKTPTEIQREIEQGKYDKEIKSESTSTSAEKKAELDKHYSNVKAAQEKMLKQEEAAKTEAAAAATAEKAPAAGEKKEAAPAADKKADKKAADKKGK